MKPMNDCLLLIVQGVISVLVYTLSTLFDGVMVRMWLMAFSCSRMLGAMVIVGICVGSRVLGG